MSVSTRFVLEQGPAIRGMGQALTSALFAKYTGKKAPAPTSFPGPEVTMRFAPRPKELIRAYAKHVGGDPGAYKRQVPAHLFPQWAFALTNRTFEGLDYPMLRAMNGGCKLIQNRPLPIDEPLEVTARLESVDDNGKRAILEQRVVTSTKSAPEAVIAHLYVFVPLKRDKSGGKSKKKKDKPRVPANARELAYWRIRQDAGLDFAKLTGDFNPIHWVPAYAKASGFRNTILHGFGTMARAIEGLNRSLFAGDVNALEEIHVRFTRPLVLPARAGLYVTDDELFVGTAERGPAYLTGTYRAR